MVHLLRYIQCQVRILSAPAMLLHCSQTILCPSSNEHGRDIVADVDLSFNGWGEDGVREAVNEQSLSVDDLIDLADSCARHLHGEQELLTLHASLSHGEEHACSLDGSGCGPEMPEPASQACRLQVQTHHHN